MRCRQAGFSLTELMVGTAVGLIVIAGALQLYVTSVCANADSLRLTRLNQELRAITDLIRNELRRSGYWAGEPGAEHPLDNPFQSSLNDIRVGEAAGEAARSCVLYSYDLNGDTRVGVGPGGVAGPRASMANMEQFGMRLRAGRVQMRTGGDPFDCSVGSWQAVSDPDTEITRLQFRIEDICVSLDPDNGVCVTGSPALLRRKVEIGIAAANRAAPDIRHSLTSEVVIANDKLFAAYP